MLFNSFTFLIFFLISTSLFFIISEKYKWLLLLIFSCFFYMYFKPEYILILGFTIVIDYYSAIWINATSDIKQKKILLVICIILNVLILAIFKYYNFINENITGIANLIGVKNNLPYLTMLLPLGLSFHTFQALSYVLEVHRGNQIPEKHFGVYSLYVMFYPQLVAGPIERPQHILPQLQKFKKFNFENLFEGSKRIIWGLFKKVVIADRIAILVDNYYLDSGHYHGFVVLLAILIFGIQIYCDFSGYSDIAVGTAKILGINLMENFKTPFFSKNVTEFWRRWHISLSSWFNDYVFTPMVINKRDWGKLGVIFALFITFTLSGIWHGAGWTFVIYGILHGLVLIFEFLTKKIRGRSTKFFNSLLYSLLCVFITYCFVCASWVFFRAQNVNQAFSVFHNIFDVKDFNSFFNIANVDVHGLPDNYLGLPLWQFIFSLILIPVFFILEFFLDQSNSDRLLKISIPIKWSIYYLLIFSILFFGVFQTKQFIYFQF